MKARQRLSVSKIKNTFSDHSSASSPPQIHLFDCLDSTNTWLKNNGQCGDVCIAEQQTAGKGRRGNQWLSPNAENIYCSLQWCFKTSPKHLSLLSLVVGLSIAEALDKVGLTEHGVKWPNDIFCQGKKMGGILIESVASSTQGIQVIIGIGLNVNMPDTEGESIDQPWISLNKVMAGRVDRNQLLAILLVELIENLKGFESLKSEEFQESWQQWDVLRNQQVRILQDQQELQGLVEGIDAQGRIGIKLPSGQLGYYSSAEIRLKKQA